jgi:hypothetical protein
MTIEKLKTAIDSISKKITTHVLKIKNILVDAQTHANNGEYGAMVALGHL